MPNGRCMAQSADQNGLPSSARAMLAYLYRNSHGQNPAAVQAFITAGDLIRESYVRSSRPTTRTTGWSGAGSSATRRG